MTKLRPFLVGLVLLTLGRPARAERLVSAYDPKVHIRPPTMKSIDGHAAELVIDADFVDAAARYRAEHPEQMVLAAPNDVAAIGEVIIVIGNTDTLLTTTGSGYGLQQTGIQELTKKVIAAFGDTYQAITFWMTFEDQMSMSAEAYEVPVKNEVDGLGGLRVMDRSSLYGSNGVLRSVLNMKTVGLRAGDTMESWRPSLETWGQESAHRWLVFFNFLDRRSGRLSDALLGRQCSHYSKYVDTQGSVHDGFAWTDNGDGSFTWTDYSKRYGNLDLYGMGLMAADEVPPFFLIDEIQGYTYPPNCNSYQFSFRPPATTIRGTRVEITIEDIIAANGERKVPTSERQNYWREAEVILTSPVENYSSPRVQMLVNRIEKARGFWEAWNREASRNRLVMCTKISSDCGDPRSDVGKLTFNAAGKGPQSGPLNLDVEVVNDGGQPATGVNVTIATSVGGAAPAMATKLLGTVEAGTRKTQSFPIDLKGVKCGTEVTVKASTQSDFHFHRGADSFLVGAQEKFTDGFEDDSGWKVNPDGDDSELGATWERGTPEASTILRALVQPAGAHSGEGAWATGLAATSSTARATLVREGKATLLSPLYDTKGLVEPMLRYWVSFAGARAGAQGLEPSDQSTLTIEGRAADGTGMPGPWVKVDSLAGAISPAWARRAVVLPAEVLKRSKVQLRFVASDANPAEGGVEAAIDDVAITSMLAACSGGDGDGGGGGGDPKGCGCRLGGRPSAGGGALLLGLALVLGRRRRR
jgi:MYXO-CTERM domain-containing protein